MPPEEPSKSANIFWRYPPTLSAYFSGGVSNQSGLSLQMRIRSFIIAGILASLGCDPWIARGAQSPQTAAMALLLKEVADRSDPMKTPYLLNAQRAAIRFQQRARALALPKGDDRKMGLLLNTHYFFSVELLNAGKNQEAVQQFINLDQTFDDLNFDYRDSNKKAVIHHLALSYLRWGEQENCLEHHSPDSCLLPIKPAGVHQLKRGSQGAIEQLMELLQQDPEDLRARWLLNLAHMTLGSYPEAVPERWRISPSVFESEAPLPAFNNIASHAGLAANGLSGGSITEDFDRDGLLDVMVSSLGFQDQLRYFRNLGNGQFKEVTEEAGLTGLVGGLNLLQTDFNNDGFPDVLVLRGAWFRTEGHHPNSLIRNNGDGTFTDVTKEAGLLSFHPTQTAVWFDANNDGWIDLFIGNESADGDVHPCELFLNQGDGTFQNQAADAGVAIADGIIKGVAAGDIDNDGWTDLYISFRDRHNQLFRNLGPQKGQDTTSTVPKFRDITAAAGVAEPYSSFPTWFFDYDNDGWLDLFVAGYRIKHVGDIAADYLGLPHSAERARLYRNNRDGSFSDVTQQSGLYKVLHAMGSNYGDLDNDGFLDIYLGTGDPDLATIVPNRMFLNNAGERFLDVTSAGNFGHLQKGHGVSFADLDNDGDQDIYHVLGGAYGGDVYRNALFENPGNGNQWITLALIGKDANRAAIGARIEILVGEGSDQRRIFRTVNSGGSFGASPLRQEIGLGTAPGTVSVAVKWPGSEPVQVFSELSPGTFYELTQGEPEAKGVRPPSFRFEPKPSATKSPHSNH